jgi:acyl-CoA thioesterase I
MKKLGILLIIIVSLIGIFSYTQSMNQKTTPISSDTIRYVALGDSYTIGEGVPVEQNYPSRLVQKFQEDDISITLIANPSMSGFTTQDLIDYELPVLKDSNPTFVTLLIGANDIAQGQTKEIFQERFTYILDEVQKVLPVKTNIVVLTIPDFSVTPVAAEFGDRELIQSTIESFNTVIKNESQKRNLIVVDVFESSQKMGQDPSLIVSDGLHPSGKEYELWVEKLLPVAKRIVL